jgi:hypothetical protein
MGNPGCRFSEGVLRTFGQSLTRPVILKMVAKPSFWEKPLTSGMPFQIFLFGYQWVRFIFSKLRFSQPTGREKRYEGEKNLLK